tara:strand:- start:58 stop:627 length:570 start_codon:yes stop_codon:yes gene_type:complete
VKKIGLLLIIFISTISFAADSTRIDTSYAHLRKKAALWSTVLPGAGSIYNEFGHRKVQGRANISWWRAPIYWAGLGFTGYFAYTNGTAAKRLKTEWLYRKETGLQFNYLDFTDDQLLDGTSNDLGFDNRSKYRDYSVAGFVLIYGLNIMDAFVDAHFVTFDVSQNLTLTFQPKMYSVRDYGVGLALKFK